MLSLTPDVCKTPVGSSTPPIPYSVYALPGEDEKTTPTVFFTGERAFVLRSNTTCTHGDEPGSAKGIKSGTVGDIAEPLDHSRTVRAEGQPVIRREDRFYLNRGNTFGEAQMAGDNTTYGNGGNRADTRGAGERFADGFTENASETWEGAKKVGSDALEGAKSIASDLWNDPLGTLSSAGESVVGGVTGAAQWTGEVGQNLWNDPGGTLGRGWENTQNAAGAVWHGVSDPYVQAYREGGVAQALGHGTFDVVRLGVEALATKGAITVAGKAATAAGVARKVGAAEGAAAGAVDAAEDVVPAARKAEQATEEIERATPDENVRISAPLRGKEIELVNMKKQKINYKKRSPEDTKKLRDEFNTSERRSFLQNIGSDPDKIETLRQAGLSDSDIQKIASGRVPDGYQVHHKLPLDDGGTNSFENLVLIKNDPFHKALTNLQNGLTRNLAPGDSITVNWPTPDGFVYPTGGQ
ncbi:PAAR-like domain-containing protein [Inquilinus sp. Marseille-Q2685]|uniref:PAAR-like domain-containing protein n=1 Tax=Inquilinus sp. Marseille-Q2685 TaxID=2866581 RepID=UPI001CE44D94|nr:PAAR-like domain-containing protein [Inquilinus sp. Marseille-Q2685]